MRWLHVSGQSIWLSKLAMHLAAPAYRHAINFPRPCWIRSHCPSCRMRCLSRKGSLSRRHTQASMTRHLAAWSVRVQMASCSAAVSPARCLCNRLFPACCLAFSLSFLALLPLPAPLRQGAACKCTAGLELLACPSDAQCCPVDHTEALPPC